MKDYEDEAFDDIEKAQQRIENKKDVALRLARDALIVCRQSNYGRNWVWPDTAIETALNNVFEAIKAIDEALGDV